MKKRVAVFAGGWGGEYLQEVLDGMINVAADNNTDIFAFVNFSVHAENPDVNLAEVNFFKTPDLCDFDGVILLANSFNCTEEMEYLIAEIRRTNVPSISVEYEIEGMHSVTTDNYSGMYDLSEHIIVEHNARNILFIGGPEDHPECQVRLKALLDAASNNGFSIPDENITFADWSKILIPGIIDNWIQAHNSNLPDAIVCANDIMAITAADHIHDIGKDVPGDVIVTGYDCINQAQIHTPSITSVNHQWNDMGALTINQLFSLIAGEATVSNAVMNTKLVIGGSCGCQLNNSSIPQKKELKRALVESVMDPLLIDSHFRHFYNAVKRADTKEVLSGSFNYLFSHEHIIEGDNFALYLDPEFFTIAEDNSNLHIYGHSEIYDAIVALDKGQGTPLSQISLKDAIFGKSEKSAEPDYYLFVPLYSEKYTYGFALLNGALNAANENQYYIWSRHMIQALEQVRTNITVSSLYEKMRLLSITDPLTGMYNRAGSESIAYPMLIDWHNNGGCSVLMLVDVDHMKIINDQFGHSSGDKALVTVTSLLKSKLPEDYVIARYGGDEFFIAGKLESPSEDIESLISNLEAALSDAVKEKELRFPLTISIGYAIISPKDVNEIEKGLVLADINMYQRKKLHHLMG